MNIEQVKELLAAAEKPCTKKQLVAVAHHLYCPPHAARLALEIVASTLAEELIKSQEALKDAAERYHKMCHPAPFKDCGLIVCRMWRAALRLEKLETKEPPPR